MANWEKKKHSPSEINNGNKFENNDGCRAEDFNASIENSLYAVEVVDTVSAKAETVSSSSSAKVSVETQSDGKKILKFEIPQGEQGVRGAKGKSIEFHPSYDNSKTYYNNDDKFDVVYYNGISYVPKGQSVSNVEPSNSEYWNIMVNKGADGIGGNVTVSNPSSVDIGKNYIVRSTQKSDNNVSVELVEYNIDEIKQEFEKHIVECNCSHENEITGFGEEDCNLVIDDQDVVITKIQGQTRRKSLNLLDISVLPKTEFNNATINDMYLYIWKGDYEQLLGGKNTNTMGIFGGIVNITEYGTYRLQIGNNSLEDKAIYDGVELQKGTYYISADIEVLNDKVVYKWIMLNEGSTALPYEPFDDTLVNSKCDFVSTGRNLWDEQWETGSLVVETGAMQNQDNRFRSKNFIAVLPNLTYYFKDNYGGGSIIAYDENQNYVESIGVFNNQTFTTNDRTHYIKFYVAGNGYNGNISIFNGDTALPYEPYIEDTMQCGLELGAFDYHDNINHITHRQTSEIITLNGSESWEKQQTASSSHWRFKSSTILPSNSYYGGGDYTNTKSNWIDANANKTWTNVIGMVAENNYIFICNTDISTVEDLKTWLASNPITFVYKLATETTEENILPSGYKVWYKGMQIQKTDTIPYILTKQYGISLASQVLNNVSVDRSQQKQIDELNNKVNNIPILDVTDEELNFLSSEYAESQKTTTVLYNPNRIAHLQDIEETNKRIIELEPKINQNAKFVRHYDMTLAGSPILTIKASSFSNNWYIKIEMKATGQIGTGYSFIDCVKTDGSTKSYSQPLTIYKFPGESYLRVDDSSMWSYEFTTITINLNNIQNWTNLGTASKRIYLTLERSLTALTKDSNNVLIVN